MSGAAGTRLVELARWGTPPGDDDERSDDAHRVHAQTRVLRPPSSAPSVLPRGSSIGRFLVLEVLGKGSAGVVYKAYDPTLGREVALKLLRSHALDKHEEVRLLDEARAMAKISHPNVVTIHEVAVEDRQVILAMEYVAGATLWQWTRQRRPWRAVVAAFRQAGRGLAAAHEAGFVHRDFKPANVLVGDDGRILVTDFGIARAIAVVEETLETRHDSDSRSCVDTRDDLVVGTPWYMAPEQHEGGNVDARSDQYAFCLALWEALCGTSPFVGQTAVELAVAKSQGAPPWPSHVAAPRRIIRALRRGLSRDAGERFPNMGALLEALDEPPVSRLRRSTALAAVPALAAVVGWGWSWQAERAQLCSGASEHLADVWNDTRRADVMDAFAATGLAYAPQTATNVVRALDEYRSSWSAQFEQACEATAVRAEQSQATLDLRMACLHRSKLELRATVSVFSKADAQVVERAATMVGGLSALQRCDDVEALVDASEPSLTAEEAAATERVRVLLADAEAHSRAAKYEEAHERVTQAYEVVETMRHTPVFVEVMKVRGEVEGHLGHYARSEATLREALQTAMRSPSVGLESEVASSLAYNLATLQERFSEARWIAEVALDYAMQRDDVAAQVEAREKLASVMRYQGEHVESEAETLRAISIAERVHGPESLQVISLRNNLANALLMQGRHVEAEAQHRQVLALRERMLGAEHPDVGFSRNNLGAAQVRQGRLEDALVHFRRARDIYARAYGPEHPRLATPLGNMAVALIELRHFEEAGDVLERAFTVAERALEPSHPALGDLRVKLAFVLIEQGRHDEADGWLRQAYVAMERAHALAHPYAANLFDVMGLLALRRGDFADAESVLQRALAMRKKAPSTDARALCETQVHLAKALVGLGEHGEARRLLELAWETASEGAVSAALRAGVAFELAKVLDATKSNRARARELAHLSASAYREAGAPWKPERAAVERWLAR